MKEKGFIVNLTAPKEGDFYLDRENEKIVVKQAQFDFQKNNIYPVVTKKFDWKSLKDESIIAEEFSESIVREQDSNVGCGECSWSGKKSELGLTDFKVDGEYSPICPECGSSDIH